MFKQYKHLVYTILLNILQTIIHHLHHALRYVYPILNSKHNMSQHVPVNLRYNILPTAEWKSWFIHVLSKSTLGGLWNYVFAKTTLAETKFQIGCFIHINVLFDRKRSWRIWRFTGKRTVCGNYIKNKYKIKMITFFVDIHAKMELTSKTKWQKYKTKIRFYNIYNE